ncbi:MAG: orotidine-5'-phosphate decarboxylase [Alphaproteobacteria bacterium]|nr:orotidine-5'-phosphate decarboxylase [Alphaproteobacteria bacterium]
MSRTPPLFGDRLAAAVDAVGSPLCVGLDPHLDRLPPALRARFAGRTGADFRGLAADAAAEFCITAIDAVHGIAAALKPQVAFFEALGAPGVAALERTVAHARDRGMLVIADAKRGDISSTAAAYARAILDPQGPLAADAVTLAPYMGLDVVQPFLPWCRDHGRGVFVLVRTTNPGSALLQRHGSPEVAQVVADGLAELGAPLVGDSGLSSVGAVVGAFAAEEAAALRARMPAAWFLVPGVGAQGGGVAEALAGARSDGQGALVNSARGILFAAGGRDDDDPATAIAGRARALADQLRSCAGAASS